MSMAERKFSDYYAVLNKDSTIYPGRSGGVFFPLTYISQGNTVNQRIGDKVTGTSLEFNLFLYSPDLLTQIPECFFRCTVFIWKDDSAPHSETLYEAPGWGTSTTGVDMLVTPLNHDYKIKRKILYDQVFAPYDRPQAADGYGAKVTYNTVHVKKVFPLTKLKNKLNVINFQSTTTSAINHIYCYISSYTTPTGGWNWDLYTRYNFVDV